MSGPLLRVEGLTKRFGGLMANEDISFDVNAGEILGVLGPNGAGKTTLFNIISGFMKPTAGAVSLRGAPITGQSAYAIARKGLLRTFQLCRPFRGMTVRENIQVACDGPRLADKQNIMRHIEDITAAVGLADQIDALVDGLPYGSQRRLEIARVLAQEPDLVLLDEPFAGLGAAEIEQLSELIRHLHHENGLNVVIIEHKLKEFMQLVDRVLVLDFGRSIADGPPDAIIKDPAVVSAYIGGGEHDAA